MDDILILNNLGESFVEGPFKSACGKTKTGQCGSLGLVTGTATVPRPKRQRTQRDREEDTQKEYVCRAAEEQWLLVVDTTACGCPERENNISNLAAVLFFSMSYSPLAKPNQSQRILELA